MHQQGASHSSLLPRSAQLPAPLFPLESRLGEAWSHKAARGLSSQDIAPKCTLGCPILDEVLKGGIPTRSVTEVAGESTAGKTQFCIQLALAVQLPLEKGGLAGSALYMYTEGRFPLRRLKQLADALQPQQCEEISRPRGDFPSHRLTSHSTTEPCHIKEASTSRQADPCDHIFLQDVQTPEDLQAYLEWRLPLQLQKKQDRPVRLIIIDSIANLFRTEYDNTTSEMSRRTGAMFRVSSCLKRYAEQYGLAVVVTNQATDIVVERGITNGSSGSMQIGNFEALVSSQRRVAPALGLAWSHCISTRLFLSRVGGGGCFAQGSVDREGSERQHSSVRSRRRMQVVFAPHLPPSSCDYTLEASGLRGLR